MPPKEKGKAQQTVIGKDASGNISFRAPAQPIAGSSDAPAAAPAPAAAQGPRTDADDFEPMDSHLWLKRQIHILTSWVWQGDKIIQGKLHGKKAAMCLLNKEKHGRQFACKTVFKNISATSSIDSHFNTQHGLFAPTDGESAQHAAGQATLGPAFEAVKPLSDEDNLAKHHALARAIVTGMLPFSVASAHWMRGWALALNPCARPPRPPVPRRRCPARARAQKLSSDGSRDDQADHPGGARAPAEVGQIDAVSGREPHLRRVPRNVRHLDERGAQVVHQLHDPLARRAFQPAHSLPGGRALLGCACGREHQAGPQEVKRAMKALEHLLAAVNAVREVHKFLRRPKVQDVWEDVKGSSKAGLSLDVATRWNSTYFMLEDYSKAREHFPAFQAQLEVLAADDEGIWEPIRLEYERLKLSPQQYNCVIGLMACLHPFAEIVPHLGGNLYTTAAATIPMIFVARSEVAEVEAPQASSGEVRQIIQAFKAELLKQLDFKTEAAYKTESYLAAALDPRFKSLDFLKYNPKNADQSIYNAVKALRNELIRMEYDAQYEAAKKKLEEAAAAAAAAAGPAAEPAPAPAPQEGRVVSSLERKLAGVTGAGAAGPARGGGPLPPAAPGNTLEPQLKSYLTEIAEWDALVALSWGQDPLVWFRKHMLDFPYVSALYRRYGSCPGSSTYSERVWSHAGQIVVENRASLNDDSIAALVNLYELYLAGVPIFELAGQIKKAVGRPEGSPDGKKRKST